MKYKYRIYKCYCHDPVCLYSELDDGKLADQKAKELNEQWNSKCSNISFIVKKVEV